MGALILGARWFLGLVFVLAGVAKLGDRAGFRRAVADYSLLPDRLVGPVAATLPWLEVAVGVLLGVGVATPAAAGLSGVLLVTFAAAVAVNLRRGRVIPCGCHGATGGGSISWWLVARNGALALLAGGVAAVAAGPSGASGAVGVGDAVAVGAVVVASLAFARLLSYSVRVRRALLATGVGEGTV